MRSGIKNIKEFLRPYHPLMRFIIVPVMLCKQIISEILPGLFRSLAKLRPELLQGYREASSRIVGANQQHLPGIDSLLFCFF
jgi:hypothetical protein